MSKRIFKRMIVLFLLLLIAIYLIPASKSDFFKQYKQRDIASESLREFQSRSTKQINIDGITWTYYRGGKGKKTLVFLHGMGGAYDLWWQQILFFEKEYQVISYTLPKEIKSLEAATKGITAILHKEKITHFNAVGTSMGGYILQYLLQRMPQRIDKAVLSNTFPPNNIIKNENRQKEKIIPYLPEFVLSKLALKQVNNKLVPAAHNSQLLAAFLPSLPFSKRQFMNRYAVVIDVFNADTNNYQLTRIPKMIMESDNDPLVAKVLREQLKNLYADATVFTFHNEGHFPYISDADTYNQVLSGFLSKDNPYQQVERVIKRYFKSRKEADVLALKSVFTANATLHTIRDNQLVNISLDDYLKHVASVGKQAVQTTIIDGKIQGKIAQFSTQFQYADKTYIDYLNLVKVQNDWKIIEKTFYKI